MRHIMMNSTLALLALCALSACAGTSDGRTASADREVYEFENVDTNPAVTGEEYRDINRPRTSSERYNGR